MSITRKLSAFTLVEMLAVIVIMGLLVGLAIPSITRLAKSGGLSSATTQVANTLNLARQYAITKRVKTRVAFPYDGSSGLSNSYWYSSYVVVALTNSTTSWGSIGRVEYLPVGTVFLRSGTGAINSLDSGSVPHPTNSSTSTTMAYIEFNPTGAASKNNTLLLQEGFVTISGTPQTTSDNATTVVVDNVVGRIQVNRK